MQVLQVHRRATIIEPQRKHAAAAVERRRHANRQKHLLLSLIRTSTRIKQSQFTPPRS